MDWNWLPEETAPQGFRAAGVRAGLKTEGLDVALIVSDGRAGAAVFTTNQFCAAPVLISRRHASGGGLRAIVANSGCANACTGEQGLLDAKEMAALGAAAAGVQPSEMLVASTGIIGHNLKMGLLREGIAKAGAALAAGGFRDAAHAILTTDLQTKQAALRCEIAGKAITIAGMAKGAGMVQPNMATVFGFFTTDAAIEPMVLQDVFKRSMRRSFNRATVDSDTSTNDTACLLASGAAGNSPIGYNDLEPFERALCAVTQELARQLVRGGEGATRLITVNVQGANSEDEAEKIALSIANSPLVKAAIFGRDPNWGRIAMAAGKAGVPFDQARVDILLNGICVARRGCRQNYEEGAMCASFERDEIEILVNLNQGMGHATAWGCDLSYEYVKINAEYHT